jgi:4-amino-4-deoxy-L-arabinose transferase-like glycosyltransferase
MTQQPTPNSPPEPSVWDYFVSELKFWLKSKPEGEPPAEERRSEPKTALPWLTISALVLALIAQLSMEPSPGRTALPGIILYGLSLGCLIAAMLKKEWLLPTPKTSNTNPISTRIGLEFIVISLFLAMMAFLLFGNGRFGVLNTLLWGLALIFVVLAFWESDNIRKVDLIGLWKRLIKHGWCLRVTRWTLIVLAVIAVILFFNFAQLDSVPTEMISDHAEKLMDINDILNGHTPVYFQRNTGREALHFYATAGFMRVFSLDVNFLNLKIVAVFANLLTLFFIYLLGKELGDRWVGLAAALFAGMAYWPLIFTRLALRIPYYPLFVAPVMYFFVRGLRRQNINDILWTGIFLGLGLHGYTPFRIVPVLVVLGILIYILHATSTKRQLTAVYALILIAFVSLLVFVPLLRYWLANPGIFAYRAFSRLTDMEVVFQRSPILIFLENFWNASVMFFWDNGVIWVHSIPRRPALELVSAAFYFLGIVSLIFRYARERDWRDLFILVSIPVLMLPSILSLAYPSENPSLNRTAGAVVPVFIVVGISFVTLFQTFRKHVYGRLGQVVFVIVVILLLVWSGANNYDLVFNQYANNFRAFSWNTSEIGHVAGLFIETLGEPETTFVVGYPHWADSRLVAIISGYPGLDYAIFTPQIPDLINDPRPKMFFLNMNDSENIRLLQDTFPAGVLWQYDSEVENKDFMIFFVPPSIGATP